MTNNVKDLHAHMAQGDGEALLKKGALFYVMTCLPSISQPIKYRGD
jgi:hypothetical protein